MATHDYVIANQGFPAFRSDLNDALAAIVSNNSSATEPTTMFAHMIWVDTAANPSILKIRNADNDAWITIGSIDQTGDTFTLVNLRTSGPVVFNDAGANVDFRVEGDTDANLLFVDASTDRVGIGTNAPGVKFELAGSGVPFEINSTNSNGYKLNFSDNGTSRGYIGSSATEIFLVADGSVNEKMRIDSSGNLLVGNTNLNNPGSALKANGQVNATVALGDNCMQYWNQGTSGDNLFAQFYTEGGGGSLRGSIDFNRGATLLRYNTTSDATLKNIIGDSDGQKSVEILNSTRIREYAWKEDETQKPQIGVIAQELYETYKGAVSVGGDFEKQRDITEEVEEEYIDEEGNTQTRTVTRVTGQETYTEYRPWAVDKTAFTFHLVAGWQAHEKIIKQQADMIAALEARIAALETGV